MNKDQLKGQVKQVEGNVKESTGKLLGDQTLENKGRIQNAVGKLQETVGDIKEEIKSKI